MPHWECTPDFDPLNVANFQFAGSSGMALPRDDMQNLHISSHFCEAVADGEALGEI